MNLDTSKALHWLPNLDIFTLPNDDLVVVSPEQEVLFSNEAFPLFNWIDGTRSIDDIEKLAQSPKVFARFAQVVTHFLTHHVFLTQQHSGSKNNNMCMKLRKVLPNTYSCIDESYIKPLLHGFEQLIVNAQLRSNLVITTDMLDCRLRSIFEQTTLPCIIIELRQGTLQISNLLNSVVDLCALQSSLMRNKPVLKFVSQLQQKTYTRPTPNLSFIDQLTSAQVNTVIDLATSQTNAASPYLVEYQLAKEVINRHALNPDLNKNEQNGIKSTLTLKSQIANYNKDGGSRTVQAEETVAKLLPFVSPLTGCINHLTTLESTLNQPVKIYRTGFFKCPPMQENIKLNEGSFVQTCLGKGVTHVQSKASALCEAIERRNAQFTGTEKSIYASPHQLDALSYQFNTLLPYSEKQYAQFQNTNHLDSTRIQAAQPYDNSPINWTELWSLSSNEKVYVPTVCCYANTPYLEDRFGKWHSNGCAAGNNVEEAILQALFELIERDATAIWWYNKLPMPSFDITLIDPEYLAPLHQTISHKHDYWVLDLTVDTSVPVMAAIGRNKETDGWTFGFGCHLKPEMAAQRALTELCQLIPIRDQNSAPFDFNDIKDDSFLWPSRHASKANYAISPSIDIKEDIINIVEHLGTLGMKTLALDYSRNDIPLSTAKVFVPGLCHIWPQLGNPRLYDTPVKLGWLAEPLTEQTINQQGLYI